MKAKQLLVTKVNDITFQTTIPFHIHRCNTGSRSRKILRDRLRRLLKKQARDYREKYPAYCEKRGNGSVYLSNMFISLYAEQQSLVM